MTHSTLGWMYANGRGVGRNDALAAAWFQLAAEAKDQPQPVCCAAWARRPARRHSRMEPSYAATIIGCQPVAPAGGLLGPPLAPSAGIDPNLVLSVIEVESAFNARAKSPKNARGLMQLLPVTARRFGTQNEWDPLENIRGGIAYLVDC